MKMKKLSVTSGKTLLISFVVDLSDIIFSVIVSILSGSIIMVSEAIQGTADLINSGFLLVGYHRSRKRANTKFQFGYGKEIYFWTIISSLIMFTITASASFIFGYHRMMNPQVIENKWLMFITLLIAFSTNSYALWMNAYRLYRNTNIVHIWKSFKTSSLIEIKTAFILDLMGAMSALIGLIAFAIFSFTGNYSYDGIGAMMIGIAIAIMAILLLTELKNFVAGKSADKQTIEKIKEIVICVDGVKAISDICTMYQGSEKLVINLDILVNNTEPAKDIGKIIDKIKKQIFDQIKETHYIQIELDN